MSSDNHSVAQIPFEFDKYQHYELDSFLPGENQTLLELLNKIVSGENSHQVYLWAPSSSGKTHLLQGICKQASKHNMRVALYSVNTTQGNKPGNAT